MPAITEKEVSQAVRRAAPNKAPGRDGIPNLTLHRALASLLKPSHQSVQRLPAIWILPRTLPKVNYSGVAKARQT